MVRGAHRGFRATTRDRRKIVFRAFAPSVDRTHAFEESAGTAPNGVWTVLGCQLAVQDGQHGRQDGQLGSQDAPTCAPKPFRARPGATFERLRSLKTAQDGSDGHFRGFLGRFFLDFRSVLERFSSVPSFVRSFVRAFVRSFKEGRAIDSKHLGMCAACSLRVARAAFEDSSEDSSFDLTSSRTYKCTWF